MSVEKMRKEFEVWATEDFGLVAGHFLRNGDEYTNFPTQCYWEAWKGSWAVIEIDLPDWFDPYGGSGEQAYWRLEVDKAIEAAGLKIKP